MAEYYGIYDYRQYKPLYIATLAQGLRTESRLITELSGAKLPLDLLLGAIQADRLGLLFWAQTEDGQKNRNRPTSIVEELMKDKPKFRRFKTHDEFKKAWDEATGNA